MFVSLLGLGGLCWWFGLEPVGHALAHASPRGLAAYLLLTALVLLGYALRWQLLATAVGGHVPLSRLLRARLAGDAVGTLVPSAKLAGEPLRIALARGNDTSTAQSTAGVALDRLLEVIGNTLAALVYVAVFCVVRGAGSAGPPSIALAVTMMLLLMALAALLIRWRLGQRPLALFYGPRARGVAPRLAVWMDGLRHVEDHVIRFFHQHPRAFVLGLLASLLIEGLNVALYHTLLAAFGIALELPVLLLVLVGGGVARAVPVPAGLGALEATQVAIGAAAGQPELGFVIGVIVRLHETLLLGLGLAALSYEGVSLARLRLASPRGA
jgi:uncharacterized protein (TIRG00374 family)